MVLPIGRAIDNTERGAAGAAAWRNLDGTTHRESHRQYMGGAPGCGTHWKSVWWLHAMPRRRRENFCKCTLYKRFCLGKSQSIMLCRRPNIAYNASCKGVPIGSTMPLLTNYLDAAPQARFFLKIHSIIRIFL